MLLPTIISSRQLSTPSVVILQSSLAQSSLAVLREVVEQSSASGSQKHTLLFCFLHAPLCLLPICAGSSAENVTVYDRTSCVPGFNIDGEQGEDPLDFVLITIRSKIQEAGSSSSTKHFHVVIDSVDTILSDVGSTSTTYKSLRNLKDLVSSHSAKSHLTLHINTSTASPSPSDLLPLLVHVSFSSPLSLIHIIAHPPALIHFLAKEYLTPPPPVSSDAKFWGVFIPVSERVGDVNKLIYGNGGDGEGGSEEIVIEIIKRGGGETKGSGRVERVLEGWHVKRSLPVDLTVLECFKSIFKGGTATGGAVDEPQNPAQNLSFNLNLTASQQEARAQVPLPYAHEGKTLDAPPTGAILYDPDSGDDIDDDDPDEDLDI